MTANNPELLCPFTIRQSGHVGQEILDQDGRIIAWTTDPWVAQVICRLLNGNEWLLRPRRCQMPESPESYQVDFACPQCGFRFPDRLSFSGHDGEDLRYQGWQCPLCRTEGDAPDA